MQDTDFIESLQEVSVSDEFAPAIAKLVRANAGEKSETIDKNVRMFLEKRSVEEWVDTLKSGDGAAQLAISYKTVVSGFEHGGDLAQAVEDILSEMVDGKLNGNSVATDWNDIVKIIPRSRQQTLAGCVVERSDSPDKRLSVAIPFLSEPLVEAAANHNKYSFVRNTLLPLIRKPELNAVSWLVEVTDRGLKCWDFTSEDDRLTFTDELRSACRASEGELNEKIRLIAEHLKIELEIEDTIDRSEEST